MGCMSLAYLTSFILIVTAEFSNEFFILYIKLLIKKSCKTGKCF